jgi:hypothetical protein
MNDVRTMLERGYADALPPPDGFERMLRRRGRKRRNQRIAAGVVGIAVFVTAVWIVTSGLSLDRSEKSVVPADTGPVQTGPAETGPPETAYPPPLASGVPDVVKQGTCSDGARWRLELTNLVAVDQNRIRVRFEVHRSPVGHSWRITLSSSEGNIPPPTPRLVFRGIRVASDSGDFVVQDRVAQGRNVARRNLFWAKAVDTQSGQVCKAHATIWG